MKVLAIVGTYRRGGIIDMAVDEVLAAAAESGAETEKIFLMDRHVEFCANCRSCTQKEGAGRGACVISDGMAAILDEAASADALVLGSSTNFGSVTAVMKRFIERLVCFAYWPWGAPGPKIRTPEKQKRVLVVASSAAPSLLARPFTRTVRLLKQAAGLLGGRTVGVLFIGMAAMEESPRLAESTRRRARRIGKKLVSG